MVFLVKSLFCSFALNFRKLSNVDRVVGGQPLWGILIVSAMQSFYNGAVMVIFVGATICLVPTITSGVVLCTIWLVAKCERVSFIVSWI